MRMRDARPACATDREANEAMHRRASIDGLIRLGLRHRVKDAGVAAASFHRRKILGSSQETVEGFRAIA
ncbi:hypothetical protein X946_4824 [Burkholderia sp. ABCPW 111]|nr:hypothetical protein X946_4824 [Burkholderia sp. ABCPW 111]